MGVLEGRGSARVLEVVRGLAVPGDATPAACSRVPPAGDGVCRVCHAAAPPGRERCPTCVRTAGQVTMPATAVAPVSLFRCGDELWRLLRGYKDATSRRQRRELRRRVSRLLSQFLRYHLRCIAPEATDAWCLTTVPSTRRRADARPLERAIRLSPWLAHRHVRTLKVHRPPAHNRAADDAFRVVRPVQGREVVLVDDTFTTGASVQSAASALQLAGARVLAVVVLGRVVNPAAAPQEAAVWEWARARAFRADRCCCCDPARFTAGRPQSRPDAGWLWGPRAG